MDRFARVVLGYHGTSDGRALELLTGKMKIAEWPASQNDWDWLGEGIYFWEHSPKRALRWADEMIARRPTAYPPGAKAAVVGAVIQLNPCFDLTDIEHTEELGGSHTMLRDTYQAQGLALPENKGGRDAYKRNLDCLVINSLLSGDPNFKTVRGVFLEGERAYPGAMIRKESHIQLAVRDRSCILGVFRPNLTE